MAFKKNKSNSSAERAVQGSNEFESTALRRWALDASIRLNSDNRSRGVGETLKDADDIMSWLQDESDEG